MASITDYGVSEFDSLASPPLGGPDGWAAAVAAVLDGSDETVNSRIGALRSLVDAIEAAKVAKAGDTMTGSLLVQGNIAGRDITSEYLSSRYGADMGGHRMTGVADPVDPTDAATKGYVDRRIVGGTFTGLDVIYADVDVTVSFGVTFASPPHVVVSASQNQRIIPTIDQITTTSMTVHVKLQPGEMAAYVRLEWIAVGDRA